MTNTTTLQTALAARSMTLPMLRERLVDDAGYPSVTMVGAWVRGEQPIRDDALPMIGRLFGKKVRAKVAAESLALRLSRPVVRSPKTNSASFAKSCAMVARQLRRVGEDAAATAVEGLVTE